MCIMLSSQKKINPTHPHLIYAILGIFRNVSASISLDFRKRLERANQRLRLLRLSVPQKSTMQETTLTVLGRSDQLQNCFDSYYPA